MIDIVVIAASLGGPEAVRKVVGGLPADFPAAIVVVQHHAPSTNELAVELLGRNAQLPVQLVQEGLRPRAGVIDVAPANLQLTLRATGTYRLTESVGLFGCAADPVLATVATCYGERAIGVILSGMQDDGAAGISALKRQGGWALVQDRATARCFGMPSAAIATGYVDYVLPLSRIADALVTLTMCPGAVDLFRVPSPFWAQACP